MKCKQCGAEVNGKFCPECGAEIKMGIPKNPSQIQLQQQVYQQSGPEKKKKKPFFLRWLFIILVIIAVGAIGSSISGKGDKKDDNEEKIVWDEIVLGDMLPEPPAYKGEIHTNDSEQIWVDISNVSNKQFNNYVDDCKDMGFDVDAELDSYSYNAYNEEGYKLSLGHYGDDADMSIDLQAPMEMDTIAWPTGIAGKQLPAPKSTIGKFSYEYDDHFYVYIGDTTSADYAVYVNACMENGFNVDYSKGEDYFHANNKEGWGVSICYVGNNIMTISIDAPDEDVVDDTMPSEEPSTETTKPEETEKDNSNNSGMNPDFKASMDSYEEFVDEYVAFMKKYAKSDGTDLDMLNDYVEFMSDYDEMYNEISKWGNKELNAEEMEYYIDVQTRVNNKLLEVAY